MGQLASEQLFRRAITPTRPPGRSFQRLCVYGRDQLSLKIVCDIHRRMISQVARFTPLFFAALVTLSSPALPKDGQITLVVGFAAGGSSSTAARIVAESVEQIAQISTVVENRPGAEGAIAAGWVLRQKGTQTLLFMSSTSSLKNLLSLDSSHRSFGDLLIRRGHEKGFSLRSLMNT